MTTNNNQPPIRVVIPATSSVTIPDDFYTNFINEQEEKEKSFTLEQITNKTKDSAIKDAMGLFNPYIIPIYVAIDVDDITGYITSIDHKYLEFAMGAKIVEEDAL